MTGAALINTETLARFPRVGVVYGGQSAEREVALGSGRTVIELCAGGVSGSRA